MRALPLVLVAVVVGCGGKKSDEAPRPGSGSGAPATAIKKVDLPDDFTGLAFHLSNGKVGKPAFDRTKIAPATPLTGPALDALLARAAPLADDPAAAQAFAFRPATEPPPAPGTTVALAFPPPPSALAPPPPPAKELTVLRFAPEGKIPSGNQLSITFSQPMVAVTSQDQAAAVVPVKLAPQPKGQWRWVGTRTIIFEPADGMFPRSTTYTVDIAAGTKSALGSALATATHFTFETPAPRLVDAFPHNDTRLERPDQPIIVAFDQAIDAAAVAAQLTLDTTPDDSRAKTPAAPLSHVKLRLATADELVAKATDRDRSRAAFLDQLHANGSDGHWVAVMPAQPLPLGSKVTIKVPTGTPSAEGPNKTLADQTTELHTYPVFAVDAVNCAYIDGNKQPCNPEGAVYLAMTGATDPVKWKKTQLVVDPAVTDLSVQVSGAYIIVNGMFPPITKVKFTLAADVTDINGQTLGKADTQVVEFGHAPAQFFGASNGEVLVADPTQTAPTLDFFTRNYPKLAVKLYKVTPGDYRAFDRYMNPEDFEHRGAPPGRLVVDRTIDVAGYADDKLAETKIDLTEPLGGAGHLGHVIAVIEPRPWDRKAHFDEAPPQLYAWVQITHLAVDVFGDPTTINAFASDLATGAPVAGASVSIAPGGGGATTAATGIATLPQPGDAPIHVLTVAKGGDTAFLPDGRWGDRWYRRGRDTQLSWFVTDDRRTYRPAETVTLKGYLRAIDHALGGDTIAARSVTSVKWTTRDGDDKDIAHGTAKLDVHGGFDLAFKLPKTPILGAARVELVANGWRGDDGTNEYQHPFQIQEFRRPEFEVSAHAGEGPFILGESGDFTVDAKYYAGGPLAAAPTTWRVSSASASYAPPGHEGFAFGNWKPYWMSARTRGNLALVPTPRPFGVFAQGEQRWTGPTVATDGAGSHVLHVDFDAMRPVEPVTVTANVTVSDVNRQGWSTQASLLVHPSARYVGVKVAKPFITKGQPFDFDVIGTDIDGKPAVGAKIGVHAVRLDPKTDPATGETKLVEVDPQDCNVVAAKDAVPCHLQPPAAGSYKLVATITDDKGRPNTTEVAYWVAGLTPDDGAVKPRASDLVHLERVELVPDKAEYAPGNTAEILVRSPIVPAEGLVRYERDGLVKLERITIDRATQVITVPIVDAQVPNLTIEIDVFGAALRADANGDPDPKAPKRPAHATGSLDLSISKRERTLAVTAKPAADKLSPGATTTVAVSVADFAGKPVADAGVAVFVVDEAVLALAQATFTDPVETFYPYRDGAVAATRIRDLVTLSPPGDKPRGKTAANQFPGVDTGGSFASLTGTADISSGFDDSNIYGGLLGNEAGEMDGGFGYGRSGFGPGGGGTGTGTIGTGRYGTIGRGAVQADKAGYKPKEVTVIDAVVAVNKPEPSHRKSAGAIDTLKPDVDSDATAAIAVRANFDPLAAFVPAATTGADGTATVTVKVPDNLTRYRIVAFALAGDRQFGKGESAVTARLPLMVRPSAPRFLNFGDTFELPVVLQNQTDAPITARVALRTQNLTLTAGNGREVIVPPNDRVEVRFPAAAASAGTAHVQVVSTTVGLPGGKEVGDAAEISLPVWTPVTTEAFATYGTIDDPEVATAQPIALPGNVVPQFGGLEVSTASTNLQALTDAVLYIVHYPYECAEQRASRMMTIAALRDVLAAFHAPGLPSGGALGTSMALDLEKLAPMQGSDGGFGFWDTKEEWPYLTVFVTHALVLAKQKGYAPPPYLLDRARNYLRDIQAKMNREYYTPETRRQIEAYALAVRRMMGDRDPQRVIAIVAAVDDLNKLELDTAGWLLSAIAGDPTAADARAKLVRLAMNRANETAGAAHLATTEGEYGWVSLWSAERADAVMLDALIAEQPANDLIPKLVTGILGSKKKGRWESTQENAFVLLALDRYFRTYEKTTPDFVARVWLGADFAGDHKFAGHTTETARLDIPMAAVVPHDKQNLVIGKAGKGRMYYRIGMSYAPADFAIASADRGFVVTRAYEAVDDQGDVTRDAKGTWHVKAGARVRVRLHMVNEAPRHHVALVDPLPAGLEALNPALATTGALPSDPNAGSEADAADLQRGKRGNRGYGGGRRYGYWWHPFWYEHENLRDERVEAFTSYLDDGVHVYTYIARATTPGTYVVPPTKAEEMYMPETFGRAASDRVVVDP